MLCLESRDDLILPDRQVVITPAFNRQRGFGQRWPCKQGAGQQGCQICLFHRLLPVGGLFARLVSVIGQMRGQMPLALVKGAACICWGHPLGNQDRWLIECYPHPALIEIFELPERLLYKKGRVDQKRTGQINLAQLLRELARSTRLSLTFAPEVQYLLDENIILGNKGRGLQAHEDALDAMVCAYIGGLYCQQPNQEVFGDRSEGYIYVPQGPALAEKLAWIERLTLFQSLFHKT